MRACERRRVSFWSTACPGKFTSAWCTWLIRILRRSCAKNALPRLSACTAWASTSSADIAGAYALKQPLGFGEDIGCKSAQAQIRQPPGVRIEPRLDAGLLN